MFVLIFPRKLGVGETFSLDFSRRNRVVESASGYNIGQLVFESVDVSSMHQFGAVLFSHEVVINPDVSDSGLKQIICCLVSCH